MHSYLLTSNHDAEPPTKLPITTSFNLKELPNKPAELAKINVPSTPPEVPVQAESYHETMRKQQRRLYSWPSREVDEFEEDEGGDADLIPRMRALESTASLSLATFTSLLIEFVARLDHLVDAVDVLAKMAKFNEERKG